MSKNKIVTNPVALATELMLAVNKAGIADQVSVVLVAVEKSKKGVAELTKLEIGQLNVLFDKELDKRPAFKMPNPEKIQNIMGAIQMLANAEGKAAGAYKAFKDYLTGKTKLPESSQEVAVDKKNEKRKAVVQEVDGSLQASEATAKLTKVTVETDDDFTRFARKFTNALGDETKSLDGVIEAAQSSSFVTPKRPAASQRSDTPPSTTRTGKTFRAANLVRGDNPQSQSK